jgi:hypothetical protein
MCGEGIKNSDLIALSETEQDLATGFIFDGRNHLSPEKSLKLVEAILKSNRTESEKLRVLLLYLSVMTDLDEHEAQRLFELCGFKENRASYSKVLVEFVQSSLTAAPVLPEISEKTKPAHFVVKQGKSSDIYTKNKQRCKASTMPTNRYVSWLEDECGDFLEGKGKWSSSASSEATYPHAQNSVKASKVQKFEAPIGGGEFDLFTGASTKQAAATPRLVVFVIGGVTLSEIRTASLLSSKFGVEVVVGGSMVLTPKRLTDSLTRGEGWRGAQ